MGIVKTFDSVVQISIDFDRIQKDSALVSRGNDEWVFYYQNKNRSGRQNKIQTIHVVGQRFWIKMHG